MQENETLEYAEQLLELHGDQAMVIAARKALNSEEKENKEEARTWRRIEAAINLMRGPHQS